MSLTSLSRLLCKIMFRTKFLPAKLLLDLFFQAVLTSMPLLKGLDL